MTGDKTHHEMRVLLQNVCAAEGQSAFARRVGVPPSVVSDVKRGIREMPESGANALGLIRIVSFRKSANKENG